MEDIDCKEEQELEIEALESICVNEFELITEDPVTYEIIINADREDEANNFVVVKMKIEYPEDYPKVLPKFQFKNLSPKNLTISDFNNCHAIFKETAEELLGEQMIYECMENVRNFLQEKNDVFVNKRMADLEEAKKTEENLGKKYIAETRLDYTPVNKDTFSEWLATYMKKRALQKEEEMKNRTKEQVERDSRKTGKNYFLEKAGLGGSNIAFEEDEIDQLIDDGEEVIEEEKQDEYFDEDLFDDDDEDLDDLDLE